jgi:hypothetical protein
MIAIFVWSFPQMLQPFNTAVESRGARACLHHYTSAKYFAALRGSQAETVALAGLAF